MLSRLWAAHHFVLAMMAYRRKQRAKARVHLNKCLKMAEPDSIALAFDATLMVLEDRSAAAKNRFEEARSKAGTLKRGDKTYLEYYCKYYECLISDEEFCDHHRVSALQADSSKNIRKWLFLTDNPVSE